MPEIRALLPRPVLPPLWREARFVGEAVDAVRRAQSPHRDCSPEPRRVLLIPGFLAGDSSMRLLARYLARTGYEPLVSGITRNIDCSEASVARLETIVEAAAGDGQRVALVGHSRGGLFARALAVRRPDLVAGIVMLGSPHRDQLAVHPVLWAQIMAVAMLGTSGAEHVLGLGCASGHCCAAFRHQLSAPLAPRVKALSVYSRSDGLVDWRSCLDAYADNLEVEATHVGMIARHNVFRAVAGALGGFDFERSAGLRAAASLPIPPNTTEESYAQAA